MPILDHDGFALAWETLGEGPPFVFSHGLGSSKARIRPLVEGISGATMWLYDNRNHGESRPIVGRDRLSFEQLSRDMAAVRRLTGAQRVVAGGISMGAAVALAFALDHPDEVRALVLSRPAWSCSGSPPNLEFAPLLAVCIENHGRDRAFTEFEKTPYAGRLRTDHPFFAGILREVYDLNDPHALVEMYRGIVPSRPFRSLEQLKGIRVPCLVCDNPGDPFHPREVAAVYAREIPGATLIALPDPAADPERHAAAFRRAVAEFLCDLPEST